MTQLEKIIDYEGTMRSECENKRRKEGVTDKVKRKRLKVRCQK